MADRLIAPTPVVASAPPVERFPVVAVSVRLLSVFSEIPFETIEPIEPPMTVRLKLSPVRLSALIVTAPVPSERPTVTRLLKSTFVSPIAFSEKLPAAPSPKPIERSSVDGRNAT